MAGTPIKVVCDVEIDGFQRQAWAGDYMPRMLEEMPPKSVHDLLEADLRAHFGLPALRLISWRPLLTP